MTLTKRLGLAAGFAVFCIIWAFIPKVEAQSPVEHGPRHPGTEAIARAKALDIPSEGQRFFEDLKKKGLDRHMQRIKAEQAAWAEFERKRNRAKPFDEFNNALSYIRVAVEVHKQLSSMEGLGQKVRRKLESGSSIGSGPVELGTMRPEANGPSEIIDKLRVVTRMVPNVAALAGLPRPKMLEYFEQADQLAEAVSVFSSGRVSDIYARGKARLYDEIGRLPSTKEEVAQKAVILLLSSDAGRKVLGQKERLEEEWASVLRKHMALRQIWKDLQNQEALAGMN